MTTKKKKREDIFWSGKNITFLLIAAVLIVLSDMFIRLPIAVQGESGLIVTALLVLAAGVIRRPGATTLIALVAGILAGVIDPSRWGALYTVLTFAAYGVGVDIGLMIMGTFDHVMVAVIAAALSNLLHFTAKWLFGIVVGVPVSVVATAIPVTAIQHLIFGLLGGLIGFMLLTLFNTQVFSRIQSEV